jgi:hypothetical protein
MLSLSWWSLSSSSSSLWSSSQSLSISSLL